MNKNPWWYGRKGEWYVVIQGLLFALVVFGPKNFSGGPEWAASFVPFSIAAGVLLIVLGGLLAAWGLIVLGKNLSPLPHPLDEAEFVESGPYRFVRHPIYSGIIIACLGLAIFVQGILTILYALVLFLFFDIKTRREERYLKEKFPEYDLYQQRVRKLIPYVY